jgi:hypothetical protein
MAGAGRNAMTNRSGRGLCAGLFAALVLPVCGWTAAGEELAAGTAPDARPVQTIPVRPPAATSPLTIRDEVRRRTTPRRPMEPRGDFWTPDELQRMQPDIGHFPMIDERQLDRP